MQSIVSQSPPTQPTFCYNYLNFNFQQYAIYLSLALTFLQFLRIAYSLLKHKTTLFQKSTYTLLLIWLTTTTITNIVGLVQFSTLNKYKDSSSYLPLDVYDSNTRNSRVVYLFLVVSQVGLQSVIVFLYAYVGWRVLTEIKKRGDQGGELGEAETKIFYRIHCLSKWFIKGLVGFGILRYCYLFILIPIETSPTPQQSLSSTFTTMVASIDPPILLFPGILLCMGIDLPTFEKTMQRKEHLRLQNTLRMLPLCFCMRIFHMIFLFRPHWYTYESQKCNISIDKYQLFDITSVGIIYATLLNFWIVHILINGIGVKYEGGEQQRRLIDRQSDHNTTLSIVQS